VRVSGGGAGVSAGTRRQYTFNPQPSVAHGPCLVTRPGAAITSVVWSFLHVPRHRTLTATSPPRTHHAERETGRDPANFTAVNHDDKSTEGRSRADDHRGEDLVDSPRGSRMSNTVTAAPLAELTEYADQLDEIEKQKKAALTARNRAVVRLVDDGYAQDAVARAIRRKPTAVTKILATTNLAAEPVDEP
jgi:hypothetical protein